MGREDEFFGELRSPGVVRDAEASRVVFARVKGYPAWSVSSGMDGGAGESAPRHRSKCCTRAESDAAVACSGESPWASAPGNVMCMPMHTNRWLQRA